jgi:hypothetical protein
VDNQFRLEMMEDPYGSEYSRLVYLVGFRVGQLVGLRILMYMSPFYCNLD